MSVLGNFWINSSYAGLRASAMAFPFVSARYPHPSSTVNTIGFGRFVIAAPDTRDRTRLSSRSYDSTDGTCRITNSHDPWSVPSFSFQFHEDVPLPVSTEHGFSYRQERDQPCFAMHQIMREISPSARNVAL